MAAGCVLLLAASPTNRVTASTQGYGPLDNRMPIGFYIPAGETETGFQAGDDELAVWALRAWERATDGQLELRPAPWEDALLHLYWVPASGGLFGEMKPFNYRGMPGAAIFVRPTTRGLGPELERRARRDPLYRDAIVYLTCLHEFGHALGLPYSAEFDDIMYSFRLGGDIPLYIQRYRARLDERADIETTDGLSDADRTALTALYPAR